MRVRKPAPDRPARGKISSCFSYLLGGVLAFGFLLAQGRPAAALPIRPARVHPLPAFARKYGLPCSSCHEAWPKLSPFGQAFKDNGYQLGNDRDAPIYQNPSYWPVTFRITPEWHRESTNRVAVDGANGSTVEGQITTHGFDWSGLDFHTGGTLAKNISFYVLPSSDSTGAFHFESLFARLDNLFGSPWLNIKFGKFELDNLLSEKRILTLSNVGGIYQNYHFQPLVRPGTPGNALVAEGLYKNGIGDNQVGVEWMGHSKDDRTRVSAALLNSNDGQPNFTSTNGAENFPTGKSYNGYFAASQAFQAGSLGLQRVGGFAYIGEEPTYFQFTSGGAGIAGSGIGNKGFYRAGLIGMWYIQKFDVTTMYFHGWDSAFLGSNTAANAPLPAGARAPTWNGALIEAHYNLNPRFIAISRYEAIRMSRQVFLANPANFGNIDVLTVGYRYYPFLSSRAGFAFHNEYSLLRQRSAAPVTGLDLTTSSLLIGFDFAY
ncbi:MAG TPA: hypothetical protein VGP19_07360 [Candidatus Acidoferrales bacterium]|jgi:hypothetical protein|nr:hypothetical protein [Candidatus Acidoferrales bacterium]